MRVSVRMELPDGSVARFGVEGTWEQIMWLVAHKAEKYKPLRIEIIA